MAARLAGLIAGAQGMPVTILKLEASAGRPNLQAEEPEKDPTRERG